MKKNSSGSGDGVFSKGESSSSSGSEKPRKLTLSDLIAFLNAVKEVFGEQEEDNNQREDKHEAFLQVLNDLKAQRIDADGAIANLKKELSKEHQDLMILGFNTFLPDHRSCEIRFSLEVEIVEQEQEQPQEQQPPPQQERRPVEFADAIRLVEKVRRRFHGNHVHQSFLEILKTSRRENKPVAEVYREVAALFNNDPDLLEDFSRFLPHTAATHASTHGDDGDGDLGTVENPDPDQKPAAVTKK